MADEYKVVHTLAPIGSRRAGRDAAVLQACLNWT